ncbi:MAG: porin family protein [Janthinobacterium lividum]
MKKVLLSLALLAGITSAAHAQSGAFKYGVKGGFSLSSYTGNQAGYSAGYKPGFTAGVLVNYGLNDNLSLQLEGLYSQKGCFIDDYSRTSAGNQLQYRSTLQYIDVPLLVKYNIGEDGKGFFVEVGPQGSFAVANREFTREQGSGAGSGTEKDITTSTDGLVPVGIGYVGGLGYQITSGLGLGIRYAGDFSHVYKDGFGAGSSGVATTNNFHNGVFQFQVHYLFGGK